MNLGLCMLKQTTKQNTNKHTHICLHLGVCLHLGLLMFTLTNKQTIKQTNTYMSAPRGKSTTRYFFCSHPLNHKQTNKQIKNKQTNKQTPLCLHLGLCKLTLTNNQTNKKLSNKQNKHL